MIAIITPRWFHDFGGKAMTYISASSQSHLLSSWHLSKIKDALGNFSPAAEFSQECSRPNQVPLFIHTLLEITVVEVSQSSGLNTWLAMWRSRVQALTQH